MEMLKWTHILTYMLENNSKYLIDFKFKIYDARNSISTMKLSKSKTI